MSDPKPQAGLLSSSEVYRINSTPQKVNEVFDAARTEARDECLWLSSVCQRLIKDNDALRIENERLTKKLGTGGAAS